MAGIKVRVEASAPSELIKALLSRDNDIRIKPQGDGTHFVTHPAYPNGVLVSDACGVLKLDTTVMREQFQGPDVVAELQRFADSFADAARHWVKQFPAGDSARVAFEDLVTRLHGGISTTITMCPT